MDNLPELRDIHLPTEVPFFPLAYGWWIILAGCLAIFLIIKTIIYLRKISKKLFALRLLEKIDEAQILASSVKISEILRRICNYKYKEAQALYGQEWIAFLQQHSKKKLSEQAAKLLIYAPYIKQNSSDFSSQNLQELKNYVQNWIGENL